jgi:hypothetical protein
MSPFRFDMLILALVITGAAIGGIYLFMLAVPRNDDEHMHDGLSERGGERTACACSLPPPGHPA